VYARIITTQARLGTSAADQCRMLENELLPLMRQQPGFRGYLGLADTVAGRVIGISLWESEADSFDFGSQRLVQEFNAKFQSLAVPGMGGAEGFQVVIDTLLAGKA
jgi:quinol monooxygenase YgiN